MNDKRVRAWIEYHRQFGRVSFQRLALSIGKTERTFRLRMGNINSFTLGECQAVLNEMHCDKQAKKDFFKEVLKAWDE